MSPTGTNIVHDIEDIVKKPPVVMTTATPTTDKKKSEWCQRRTMLLATCRWQVLKNKTY
jgi:hypothetical protein